MKFLKPQPTQNLLQFKMTTEEGLALISIYYRNVKTITSRLNEYDKS